MDWADWLFILRDIGDSVDRPTERAALRRISHQAAYAQLIRENRYPTE